MIYQIRSIHGMKQAEFEIRDEARHFLSKQPVAGLEVWTLAGIPGELIGIKPASDFLRTHREYNHHTQKEVSA